MPLPSRSTNRTAKTATAAPQGLSGAICPPHHWLIGEPDGPTSPGQCKRCGMAGVFRNYADGWLGDGWQGAHRQRMEVVFGAPSAAEVLG